MNRLEVRLILFREFVSLVIVLIGVESTQALFRHKIEEKKIPVAASIAIFDPYFLE